MAQQLKELVSLLTDMRSRLKDGTHKTLSNIIFELNGMVWYGMVWCQWKWLGAKKLVGKLTMGIHDDLVSMKIMES